jgi:hypothetical protein
MKPLIRTIVEEMAGYGFAFNPSLNLNPGPSATAVGASVGSTQITKKCALTVFFDSEKIRINDEKIHQNK